MDIKDSEAMKAAMQRINILAQEMEVGNVVTFDKRKRLLMGEKVDGSADQVDGGRKRGKDDDRLVKLLKKEMENRKSRQLRIPSRC